MPERSEAYGAELWHAAPISRPRRRFWIRVPGSWRRHGGAAVGAFLSGRYSPRAPAARAAGGPVLERF